MKVSAKKEKSSKDFKFQRCDLIKIPKKLAVQKNCTQMLLCTKTGTDLHFLDMNHRKVHIQKQQYLDNQGDIEIFPLNKHGQEFEVIQTKIKQGQSQHKEVWTFTLKDLKNDQKYQIQSLFLEQVGKKVLAYPMKLNEKIEQNNDLPQLFIAKKQTSLKESKVKKVETKISNKSSEQSYPDVQLRSQSSYHSFYERDAMGENEQKDSNGSQQQDQRDYEWQNQEWYDYDYEDDQ